MPNDIKISTSLDTASIRNAESAFRGLITLADKLNKSTDRISQSVSKINTGGQTGQANRPGAIKSGPQGQVTGISGAILGDPSQAERAAQRIIAAFDRVEQKAQRMSSSVKSMGGAGGGDAGWSARAMSAIEGGVIGGGSSGGTSPSGAPLHRVPAAGGGGGLGGGRFGASGALSGGAQGILYGVASGVESLASGNLGGFLGSTAGRLGIAGAVAYGGYRIASALSDVAHDGYFANQQFALRNSTVQQQVRSQVFSPLKNLYGSIAGNDLGTQAAFSQVKDDTALWTSITNTSLAKQNVIMNMRSDTLLRFVLLTKY